MLLVAAAVVAGVIVLINPFADGEEDQGEKSPWFYQVAREDIEVIEVMQQGDQVRFFKEESSVWAFEEPAGIPPALDRWRGVVLLLSGPQTRRDLTAAAPIIDDPAQYGLDDPLTVVNVGLTHDRQLQLRLGDTTTDGRHHYAQVIGFPQLFIVSSAWGDVISKLATEPPLPEWYVKRDPGEIAELNIYLGDPEDGKTPRLKFSNNGGVWSVRDFRKDSEQTPVDAERWSDILPLLSGPTNVSVEVSLVDDSDFTPWGITDDSSAIEIRFFEVTRRRTTFVDSLLFRIGSKTADERGYYGRVEEDRFSDPVLVLDADWTEALLDLFDDVPYARDS